MENVYAEALYDKAASAASVTPQVEVAPTRGTRADRAEQVAQKRRRAFRTFLLTALDKQVLWALDWHQTGAMYAMPWKNPTERYPYAMRFDPRWAYPLAHNGEGELTQAFFLRYRPLNEVQRDYGIENQTLGELKAWAGAKSRKEPRFVEEIWYVDEKVWGMALVASEHPTPDMYRYMDPLKAPSSSLFSGWLLPKEPHNMGRCPVVEKRRESADGEYRGALDDMIPNLRAAQSIMSRLMEMLDIQTATPIGLDNVANPEEFKPGGIVRGTGEGDLKIVIPQWPVNFEALQHKNMEIESARNVGAYPQQRSGEHGASIASGKASQAVMGAFNVSLAWCQRDMASFFRSLLQTMAEYDEKWCGGYTKDITGWDEGEIYSDTYDPAAFWKQDYRCEITFNRVGLEEHNWLTRLGLFKQMGALSNRSMMRKSGIIDNFISEEAEMDLEAVKTAFFNLVQQQALQGNGDPLYRYAAKIDSDKMSPREAMWATIKEMRLVTSEGRPVPGQGGGMNPGQMSHMERSFEAGGIPGRAEGIPAPRVGGALAAMLPSGMGRAMADIAPAGR